MESKKQSVQGELNSNIDIQKNKLLKLKQDLQLAKEAVIDLDYQNKTFSPAFDLLVEKFTFEIIN